RSPEQEHEGQQQRDRYDAPAETRVPLRILHRDSPADSRRPAVTRTSQASGGDMLALRGALQEMRIVTDEERTQQLGIIRADGGLNAWPFRQFAAPLPHSRSLGEDGKIDELVEHIEIAEYRRKHRIHQAEAFTPEERARA